VATYLPTADLSPLFTFVQFSGTVSAFQSALAAAFPLLTIQCFADGQVSGNALIVANDQTVVSVAPNWYAGYNGGQWAQYPAAKLAGGANSLFTAYP
jgi:hypothetical protein